MSWIKKKLNNNWRSYEYCSIDIETTGLDLSNDEVISIGAVSVTDGRFNADGNFYEEISPAKNPSVSSIQVHGLRAVDLESARLITEVIPELITHMQGKYLITHSGWIERAFLSENLKKGGYKFPKFIIDTAVLAGFAGYTDKGWDREPSLELLARKLNVPVYAPHHALGDAMTTAAVFFALVAKIERDQTIKSGENLTLKKLLDYSRKR